MSSPLGMRQKADVLCVPTMGEGEIVESWDILTSWKLGFRANPGSVLEVRAL
jgi:hypothetical protein